mmetsp:Transcript_130647/g.194632  ORF Transcript_130647/g.194632 Transcript_130647/m.194632 type:complete len:282 (-) Transcript_130647:137-982(-)
MKSYFAHLEAIRLQRLLWVYLSFAPQRLRGLLATGGLYSIVRQIDITHKHILLLGCIGCFPLSVELQNLDPSWFDYSILFTGVCAFRDNTVCVGHCCVSSCSDLNSGISDGNERPSTVHFDAIGLHRSFDAFIQFRVPSRFWRRLRLRSSRRAFCTFVLSFLSVLSATTILSSSFAPLLFVCIRARVCLFSSRLVASLGNSLFAIFIICCSPLLLSISVTSFPGFRSRARSSISSGHIFSFELVVLILHCFELDFKTVFKCPILGIGDDVGLVNKNVFLGW